MRIAGVVAVSILIGALSIVPVRAEVGAPEKNIDLTAMVPPEVAAVIAPLVRVGVSNNSIIALQVEEQVVAGKNVSTNMQTWKYKRLENGLASLVKKSDSEDSVDHILTVCGAIDVVTTRQARMSRIVGSPIPLIESSNTDMVRKYIDLNADVAVICQPQAGSTFVVEGTVATEIKFSGTGGERTKNVQMEEKTSCQVGTPSPASSLEPTLTGDYLRVLCDTSWSNSTNRHSEFVFLKDLNFYIPLARDVTPTITSSFRIKHVEVLPQ
jgi:hypothetical protein